MATRIPQRELRNNNADILNRVEAGESFVVTRNGVAIADVVPHAERTTAPMFPSTRELVTGRRIAGGSAPDGNAWLRDIRAADALIADALIDDDPLDDDPLDDRG